MATSLIRHRRGKFLGRPDEGSAGDGDGVTGRVVGQCGDLVPLRELLYLLLRYGHNYDLEFTLRLGLAEVGVTLELGPILGSRLLNIPVSAVQRLHEHD